MITEEAQSVLDWCRKALQRSADLVNNNARTWGALGTYLCLSGWLKPSWILIKLEEQFTWGRGTNEEIRQLGEAPRVVWEIPAHAGIQFENPYIRVFKFYFAEREKKKVYQYLFCTESDQWVKISPKAANRGASKQERAKWYRAYHRSLLHVFKHYSSLIIDIILTLATRGVHRHISCIIARYGTQEIDKINIGHLTWCLVPIFVSLNGQNNIWSTYTLIFLYLYEIGRRKWLVVCWSLEPGRVSLEPANIPLSDWLMGAYILVLSAELAQLAIVTIRKCAFPCFKYSVGKVRQYRFAQSRTVYNISGRRKSVFSDFG